MISKFLLAELFDIAFSVYYAHGDNTDDAALVLQRQVSPFINNVNFTAKNHQSFLRTASGVAEIYSSITKGQPLAATPVQMSTSYSMLGAGVHGSYQALAIIMLGRWAKHFSGDIYYFMTLIEIPNGEYCV